MKGNVVQGERGEDGLTEDCVEDAVSLGERALELVDRADDGNLQVGRLLEERLVQRFLAGLSSDPNRTV